MGLVDGVTGTGSGWLDGGEVVEVKFDPEVVSYEELLGEAQRRDCANVVFPRSDAQEAVAMALAGERATRSEEPVRLDDDTKYYLQQTSLRYLPMTSLQAARANGTSLSCCAATRQPRMALTELTGNTLGSHLMVRPPARAQSARSLAW